ncbi:MAG: GNAT family N-acetyltransferase [Ferruginibacter sp.]
MTQLEEVTIDDAKVICDLRNNERNNKYLSSSAPVSIGDQQSWIINNKAKQDGYYLKIIDLSNDECCGTISLYNISENKAEFGRYIATRSLQAIEAEYLLIKLGFEALNLKEIYCRTAIENTKVWQQHYKFGFRDIEEIMLKEKALLLKVQEISADTYNSMDYSFINKIIERFNDV